MNYFFILLIKLYKKIFSGFQVILHGSARTCHFYPSCSDYAIESLEKSSLPKATLLIVKRIISCHPFQKGGYDPV